MRLNQHISSFLSEKWILCFNQRNLILFKISSFDDKSRLSYFLNVNDYYYDEYRQVWAVSLLVSGILFKSIITFICRQAL